ncbi:MAG: phosphoglucosamine mutase [Verrucomicrobiota bacterium]
MKTRYFGTDGIRGPANGPYFTPEFIGQLTGGIARFLRSSRGADSPRIVIGRDTRESGAKILAHLIDGFGKHRGECIDLGIVPTPAVSSVVLSSEADLGISITASHNPAEDNGIKLFSAEGTKLSDAEEETIEALMLAPPPQEIEKNPEHSVTKRNGMQTYLQGAEILSTHLDLEGLTIVCDTANGATVHSTPVVLSQRGAQLVCIGDSPDGKNINAGCGSEHAESMAEMVVKHNAALGIAHDGDGDRVIFSDEKGAIVPGDQVLGIFALNGMRKQSLSESLLVTTIQSNRGLDLAIEKSGGKVERTDVGDRNVAERMRKLGASLGGESSGHIILHNYSPTGDGLLAALYMLRILQETGQTLSELRQAIPLLPQVTSALTVPEKIPLEECSNLQTERSLVESEIGNTGRVLLRYSGTEPKLRFLVEATTVERCNEFMAQLLEAAKIDLVP